MSFYFRPKLQYFLLFGCLVQVRQVRLAAKVSLELQVQQVRPDLLVRRAPLDLLDLRDRLGSTGATGPQVTMGQRVQLTYRTGRTNRPQGATGE